MVERRKTNSRYKERHKSCCCLRPCFASLWFKNLLCSWVINLLFSVFFPFKSSKEIFHSHRFIHNNDDWFQNVILLTSLVSIVVYFHTVYFWDCLIQAAYCPYVNEFCLILYCSNLNLIHSSFFFFYFNEFAQLFSTKFCIRIGSLRNQW